MNYLSLYLNTSEKQYNEDNKTVFYLTQDKDFTDCKRVSRTWTESRFETRFEAALTNTGEAVVFISEFLKQLSLDDRSDIESTIYLRNDIYNNILTAEHFDIYEMLKYMPYFSASVKNQTFLNQMHNKVALRYDEIKIKWFDKIVTLMQGFHIKIGIANTTEEQYKRDMERLSNYRRSEIRQSDNRRIREEKGIKSIFESIGRK